MFLRLKSKTPKEDPRLLISKMFRVSNDLYGNTVASAHELAKGYTRPVSHDAPRKLPPEIKKAHEEIVEKRKLNLILSSKSIQELPIRVGDIVQIHTKLQNQKRGNWSEPQPVLHYDPEARTLTIPGSRGKRRQAAIEDVRHALCENELAVEIQSAIDVLTRQVDESLEDMDFDADEPNSNQKPTITDEDEEEPRFSSYSPISSGPTSQNDDPLAAVTRSFKSFSFRS